MRAEHSWTEAELGNVLGVSRQSVNAIEAGRCDPSLPLAFKLARLFNTAIEEIFTEEPAQ
jgi:putative transcriptional regulator